MSDFGRRRRLGEGGCSAQQQRDGGSENKNPISAKHHGGHDVISYLFSRPKGVCVCAIVVYVRHFLFAIRLSLVDGEDCFLV